MTPAVRQAAELAIIPELMLRVIAGATLPAHPDAQRAAVSLVRAREEASRGLTLPERSEAARMIESIVEAAEQAAKFTDRLGLVAYHFAKLLTDCDAIAIGEDSYMGSGLRVVLAALERAAQDERLDEAARKQALRTLRAAQARGLFRDVTIEIRRAA